MDDDTFKAVMDSVKYGTGFMKDGKHIPVEEVVLSGKEHAALRAARDRVIEAAVNWHKKYRQYVSHPNEERAADFLKDAVDALLELEK